MESSVTQPDKKRKSSGKRSLPIPDFDKKLPYLLDRAGRQQKWLIDVLATPHGAPTASGITGWKNSKRLPIEYVGAFCLNFGIDETILIEPNFDRFKSETDKVLMPGSGRYWKTLLEKATETSDGLRLLVEDSFRPALRNIMFQNEPFDYELPRIQHVNLDQRLRFSVPAATIAKLISDADCDPSELTITLCCEDQKGWKTLCPHRHDIGFVLEGDKWTLPEQSRPSLKLAGPLGRFRAVAVIAASLLPTGIHEGLRADRTVWATDALAAWLFQNKIPHLVLQREFLVTVPLRAPGHV
jgi:hypothetical protein